MPFFLGGIWALRVIAIVEIKIHCREIMSHIQSTTEQSSWILGLFAKQPLPGRVKSRLARVTEAKWATQVAEAFLGDLVERFSRLCVRRILVYAPVTGEDYFRDLVKGRFFLVPQGEGDLGQRLTAFLQEQFQSGAQRVVLVGMDSPTLPLDFVEQAFQNLDSTDVVLGPATDGGYYLVGCSRFVPDLFQEIHWSQERVLFETVTQVQKAGLRLSLLPPWYDVDTLPDWWMLKGHLAAWRQAGIDPEVPRTEQLATEFSGDGF